MSSTTRKALDEAGLSYLWQKIKDLVSVKVDKVDGKQLSTQDYTTDEKFKLLAIQNGAQVNLIEKVYVNGQYVPVQNKTIFISTVTPSTVNETVQNAINNVLVPPAEEGTYVLMVTVDSNGVPMYQWIGSRDSN